MDSWTNIKAKVHALCMFTAGLTLARSYYQTEWFAVSQIDLLDLHNRLDKFRSNFGFLLIFFKDLLKF